MKHPRWAPAWALAAAVGLLPACLSGARPVHPTPSPGVTVGRTGNGPAIRNGTYELTVTYKDVVDSDNGHLIDSIGPLTGRYVLSVQGGRFSVTLDGRSAVAKPSPGGTQGTGAYARYGFWVFLGVPPIGKGTFRASATEVVFHSLEGACFQSEGSPSLLTGRYRWKLDRGRLGLSLAGGAGTRQGALGDGCLGRSFVFTAHPWIRRG